MKSSKSSVRWALAPAAESSRERPARAEPRFTQMCRREPQILAGSLASPTPFCMFCTVLQLTVTLCLVYITLNCNSLNRRPNCFLYVYVQTFVLTPCLAFITWTRTSEQNPHGRRLTSKAQAHSEDGLDQGFGQLGHLTAPSLSGSHPQAWPAVISPRAFKEAMEPSVVIQAVGWSEDMRWGAAFTWGTIDLTSRVTQMWSSLCPLFPEWRRPPLALPAPCGRTGTQDSEEGEA